MAKGDDQPLLTDNGIERGYFRYEQYNGGTVGGLARLGLMPSDIDLVIDTHLHNDH